MRSLALGAAALAGVAATLVAVAPASPARPEIDPVVSPEFAVADLGIRAAPSDQTMPAVAFDGTNYLVVWADTREGTADVYGTRVAPDGTVLDVGGFAISTAPNPQLSPDVAFDGTNFLVVWSDERRAYDDYDVYAARVSSGGAVLDPAGIPVSTEYYYDQQGPHVAFDGTNYLAVWTDYRNYPNDGDVYGGRISPAGAVLDGNGFPLSTAPSGQFAGGIAFGDANYFVSWTDGRNGPVDVYGTRVTPSASVLDPAGFAISTAGGGQFAGGVAFDGTNWLAVWDDGRSGPYDIYGARVTQAGTVLDASGIPVSTAPNSQANPHLAFDGTDYLVAWNDSRSGGWDAYAARITRAGDVLDPAGISVSTAAHDQALAHVAFGGGNFFVVWRDNRGGTDPYNDEAYGTRVTPAGEVLDPAGRLLSITHASQTWPSTAFDGANYLVVWEDDRSGSGPTGEAHDDIYAARVTQNGTFLDGSGIPITTGPVVEAAPSVAFDGTNYLVVWSDYRQPYQSDIYGARVSPSGEVLDESSRAISTAPGAQLNPVVAFDGTNYLVAWADTRTDLDGDVYAARVSPAGSVLDPAGIPVSAGQNSQWIGGVTAGAGNYFVIWSDSRANGFVSDTYGARVSSSGTVLDAGGIPISTATGNQSASSVAFDGSNYVVAWSDERGGDLDAYAARVSPAGSVLDPNGIAVSTAAGDQEWPAVVFGDASSLLVWADSRQGGHDLYGARVDRSGGVLDPSGFFVGSAEGDFVRPSSVATTAGRVAVAYHRRIDASPPLGTTRAFVRFVDPAAAPPPPPPPPPSPPGPPPPPRPVRCKVPRVIRMTLGRARVRIRRAHCSVGRVRRARSHRIGRVLSQKPRPGAVRPRRTRVNLVVGRR